MFRFRCQDLSYADNVGERCVEIPVASLWYAQQTTPILEVGAVLPYWYRDGAVQLQSTVHPVPVPHRVLDPFDPYEACLREDAVGYDYTGLTVLSISTLEHIGVDADHYGTSSAIGSHTAEEAADTFLSIIDKAQHYFITWPLGHSPVLDRAGESCKAPHVMFHQLAFRQWELGPDNWAHKYNAPFPYGNGCVIFSDWFAEWS